MASDKHSYISDTTVLPEITIRVILLSIVLTVILAMSNAYLALKVGILASASIPAAILSMGILRFFKDANILENNLVQTAASAGEAVAGGIVYTAPALIMIQYWQHFNYWENFSIALLGGLLGVFFSIPLRRVLVSRRSLPFPEGRAIAEVLIAGSHRQIGFSAIVKGGIAGGLIELAQTGLKFISSQWQYWTFAGKSVVGIGLGFSAPMLGVGYIIGPRIGISLFIGACLGWLIGIPISSLLISSLVTSDNAQATALNLWELKIRFVGIGAMLTAGLITLCTLIKPFYDSIHEALRAFRAKKRHHLAQLPRTERDIPFSYVLIGTIICLIILGFYFSYAFPTEQLNLSHTWLLSILIGCILYIFIIGFISSALTGYFSGLVGVTASPGSAIVIAGLLIATAMLRIILPLADFPLVDDNKLTAASIAILLSAFITSAAAIANDNIQDLKVGHLVGSTPWKQQLMLILGVIVSAAIIPLVMELLFQVYGIGNITPHAGMDSALTLPAPPAAMMAAVAQGVFNYNLEWQMIAIGALLMIIILPLNGMLLPKQKQLSLIGISMGIYLPLSTSMPLFIGGIITYFSQNPSKRSKTTSENTQKKRHCGTLVACGLVAGAAVMTILLAIPFVLTQSPNALAIVPTHFYPIANLLGATCFFGLCFWLYRATYKNDEKPTA